MQTNQRTIRQHLALISYWEVGRRTAGVHKRYEEIMKIKCLKCNRPRSFKRESTLPQQDNGEIETYRIFCHACGEFFDLRLFKHIDYERK